MKEDSNELNKTLKRKAPVFYNTLSKLGKTLYAQKASFFKAKNRVSMLRS